MLTAYVALGSNEGDRLRLISDAVEALHRHAQITVRQIALLREYAPVGGPLQAPYINGAVELDVTLDPHALLRVLHQIERQLGRVRTAARWAPRTMDLDLLLHEEQVIRDPELTLPHPRMHERAFVLEPLAQIAPDVVHPVLQQTISALCARVHCVNTERSFAEHRTPNTERR